MNKDTAQHLRKRLESSNLSPEYKAIIEGALKRQKEYQGFFVGERVRRCRASFTSADPRARYNPAVWEVVDEEEFREHMGYPMCDAGMRQPVPLRLVDAEGTGSLVGNMTVTPGYRIARLADIRTPVSE